MGIKMVTAIIAVGAILVASIFLSKATAQMGPSENPKTQAQQLIDAYSLHRESYKPSDAMDALRSNNFIFYYDDARKMLMGGIYINGVSLGGASPEKLEKYRHMARALNDPTIGGMFDQAGGHFVLDEERQAYYLMREFSLATSTKAHVIESMDGLYNVSGMWLTHWFARVAMIMHGNAAAPTAPVTLADPEK